MKSGLLPLYLEPPQLTMSVAALEQIMVERLRLLLDCLAAARAGTRKGSGLDTAQGKDPSSRAEDAAAHFALRIAFASPPALAERLITGEVALLHCRWEALSAQDQKCELAAAGLEVHASVDGECCKVPFQEAPPALIAKRKVVLQRGLACVPLAEAGGILAQRFELRLRNSLTLAVTKQHMWQHHVGFSAVVSRFQAVGQQLCAERAEPHLADPAHRLSLSNFEECLRSSLPPCMRRLVLHQRTGRHLKHLGRLQLRPFLREAGFTLQEALRWWTVELCQDPSLSVQDFERTYRYDIEHAWGARGHGRGAFAYSCSRIIGFELGFNGQVHGCPFKVCRVDELSKHLAVWGAPPSSVGQIVSLAVEGQPRAACAQFFQSMHPGWSVPKAVSHPNALFRLSRKYAAAAKERMPGNCKASDVCKDHEQ